MLEKILEVIEDVADEEEGNYKVRVVSLNNINKVVVEGWDKAQMLLDILLNGGYQARVYKNEKYYVIEYDWLNEDWTDRRLLWTEEVFQYE